MNARRIDEMMIASEMRIAALMQKWMAKHYGDRLARLEGENGISQGDEEAGELAGQLDTGEDTEGEPEVTG
jgi:hypothetical protein